MSSPCDCTQDGWCARYQRDMTGRFREICAGVNVDLGTAAAFRAQWAREAGPVVSTTSPKPILLVTEQAPGDAVAMTAAIYSLHRAHPGKYLTAVESPYQEVFLHNPDVMPCSALTNPSPLRMHYPAINDSNTRGIHFMQGWCEHLEESLGVRVPLLTNRPHLYFSEGANEGWMPTFPEKDYWVICSGGKSDFTNKLWGQHNYQEVVTSLIDKVHFVQVGSTLDTHIHLRHTENMLGKTSLRALFHIVRHARGVVCGVSLLMHIAAALEVPSIVIAGGREPVVWNAYPKQHYLHTVGMLPCTPPGLSQEGACWRSRVLPLNDGTSLDRDTCLFPLSIADGSAIPACMERISPRTVVDLIRSYERRSEVKHG